jgi:type I restriction enzyme, S subunit
MSAECSAVNIPPGYKQTEVGVIPEEWEVINAFDACSKIQDGTHFSPRISGNDYFYITSKNIRFGYFDISTASRIDTAQHQVIYRRCDVKKGDLLLTKDGASTGNAALNTLDEEFSLLSSVAFLRFNQSKYCAAYFLQQILTSPGQRQIQDAMAGNAITRLTLEKIKKLRFPVPPTLVEQEAIAEALSDADVLIESLDISKKRQIKQGAMQELLTGKRRLPGFSGEWEVKMLGELASIQRGASPRPIDSSVWFDDNSSIGWVRISDVTRTGMFLRETTQRLSSLGVQNSRLVSSGSLIMSICATVGRPVITEIDICIHDGFVVFDGLRMNKRLLYYILKSIEDNWSRHGQTGSQMNLNTGLINRTTIVVPSTHEEQTAIAAILSDMDSEITALEEKLTKARQLKQGMMQELLTGRIRLI